MKKKRKRIKCCDGLCGSSNKKKADFITRVKNVIEDDKNKPEMKISPIGVLNI